MGRKWIILEPSPTGKYSVEDLLAAHPDFKIPKIVKRVIDHYNDCFVKRDCIHCPDCIAFAMIFSEILEMRLPPQGVPYVIPGDSHYWNFIKFLLSTITKEYLPCDRALDYETIKKFALALLRVPIDLRGSLRKRLICHAEFKMSEYKNVVIFYRMKPRKYERYRKFRIFEWAQRVTEKLNKLSETQKDQTLELLMDDDELG